MKAFSLSMSSVCWAAATHFRLSFSEYVFDRFSLIGGAINLRLIQWRYHRRREYRPLVVKRPRSGIFALTGQYDDHLSRVQTQPGVHAKTPMMPLKSPFSEVASAVFYNAEFTAPGLPSPPSRDVAAFLQGKHVIIITR
jgi:hypothetical protein